MSRYRRAGLGVALGWLLFLAFGQSTAGAAFSGVTACAHGSDTRNSKPCNDTATYTRDNDGQVASDSSVSSSVGSDKYNTLNQLCYAGSSTSNACGSPPAGADAYALSSADNLTNNNGNAQQYNNADELCWVLPSGSSANACGSPPTGATTFGSDNSGNRTSEVPSSGSATCNSFNQANLLTEIQTGTGSTCTSPTTVGTYVSDGLGLRESKTVSGTTTQFTNNGINGGLLQQDAGGTITSFIDGPNGIPLEQITSSTTTYLHQDQLGSIRLITDSAGATGTATTNTWNPYGGGESTSGSLTSPFGFAGMYTDAESGLLAATHRYYDPTTATWLSVDPLVSSTMQPYQYALGSPLVNSDPTGLTAIDPDGRGVGANWFEGLSQSVQDQYASVNNLTGNILQKTQELDDDFNSLPMEGPGGRIAHAEVVEQLQVKLQARFARLQEACPDAADQLSGFVQDATSADPWAIIGTNAPADSPWAATEQIERELKAGDVGDSGTNDGSGDGATGTDPDLVDVPAE